MPKASMRATADKFNERMTGNENTHRELFVRYRLFYVASSLLMVEDENMLV